MTTRRVRVRPPWPLLVLGLVAIAFFALPLAGLLAEAPWGELGDIVTGDVALDALRLSLVSSVIAAAISLVFGVPLAWLLSRADFRGKSLVRAVVTLPMVLPPVVGGAALLFALGRRGSIGEPLYDATGFLLPFSLWGVVVANTFVAMPFLVITVEGALNGLDGRHEAAAASLGASRLEVFRRVTVPMIAPSLRAGVLLAPRRAACRPGATVRSSARSPAGTPAAATPRATRPPIRDGRRGR